MGECGRSCKYWPPSSTDGKPCGICDTSTNELNCYQKRSRGRPSKPNAMKKEYHVRLNDIQREQLRTIAAKHGKSEAAMLRELIKKAFERS